MVTDRPISHVVLDIDQGESAQHKQWQMAAGTPTEAIATSSGSTSKDCTDEVKMVMPLPMPENFLG